jgi:hypothetical protein
VAENMVMKDFIESLLTLRQHRSFDWRYCRRSGARAHREDYGIEIRI